MKVLCLHGRGTSGAIFKSQTAAFRKHLLDLDIEFDFIDGPYCAQPAPGVDLFYEPPYYSFYEHDSLDAIDAARKWLLAVLARSGPYDAVIMFSQGCVLGATMLLLHQAEIPDLPPPFNAAIFICGGVPLAVAESIGFQIPAEVRERDVAGRRALWTQADSKAILARGADRWAGLPSTGKSEEDLRREITGPCQIPIPTVHVYGSKDPLYVAGVQLSGMCEETMRRVYDHGGGHEIPRTRDVSKSIADLIRWALVDVHERG